MSGTARQKLAGWRRRSKANKTVPTRLRAANDRRVYAQLYENRALYEPPEIQSPEEILIARERTRELAAALAKLPAREERVLRLHYGLDDSEPLIFAEIGEQVGVTGGRAQQIEHKAFRRLQHPARHLDRLYGDRIRTRWARRHDKPRPNLYVPQWKLDEARTEAEKENKKRKRIARKEAKWRATKEEADRERIADWNRKHEGERPYFTGGDKQWNNGAGFDLRRPRNPEQATLLEQQRVIAAALERERAVLAEMRLRAAALDRREAEILEEKARERRRAETQRIEAEEREIRRNYVRALNSIAGDAHYDPGIRVIYQKLGMTPPTPGKQHG